MKPGAAHSVKPPLKRRKLLKSDTETTTTIGGTFPVESKANTSKGVPICATCLRALQNTTSGGILQCGICLSTTCAVCSRICTHSTYSLPPTPHLTWSPTPSPSPVPSPRRSVLSLNSSNVNLPLTNTPTTPAPTFSSPKRRKHADDDDLSEIKNYLPGEDQAEFGPGCGTLVCKKCCYEDSVATTCLKCQGLPT